MTDRSRGRYRFPGTTDAVVSRRVVVRGGAGAGLALAGIAAGRLPLAAQDATPGAEGGPPLPPGATVLASGLLNPRFVVVADDGTIYVSEAGTGGDEQIFAPGGVEGSPAASPAAQEAFGTRGATGRVSRIGADGTATVVADGLPSYTLGQFEATGPAGITVADGTVWLAVGGPGPGAAFIDPLPNENSVVSIDPASGTVTSVANVGDYERANNPHPAAVDSNLYGLAVGDDGKLHVADAGGNAVYHLDPSSGELTVLAVLEDVPLPEGAQGPPTLEPVPTGVTPNPAGGIYVGLLSGGPFPPGAAKVLAVAEDGTVTDAATGLTMVVDVTVGPDGNLYASQISTNFLSEPPAPGSVVRIGADGAQEPVVEGLMLPNGIDFDADGNLYVVAGTVSFGAPAGMVLRFDGVAAATDGTPSA